MPISASMLFYQVLFWMWTSRLLMWNFPLLLIDFCRCCLLSLLMSIFGWQTLWYGFASPDLTSIVFCQVWLSRSMLILMFSACIFPMILLDIGLLSLLGSCLSRETLWCRRVCRREPLMKVSSQESAQLMKNNVGSPLAWSQCSSSLFYLPQRSQCRILMS